MAGPDFQGRLVRFAVFEVDLISGELWKQGRRIALHDQAFHALALLLAHPGELVSREKFRQELWPADTFIDFDKSLNTTVSKLRDALGDSAASPRFIETLPRRGYRFLSPVEAVPQTTGVSADEVITPASEPPPTAAAAPRAAGKLSKSWLVATVAGVLIGGYALRKVQDQDTEHPRVSPLTTYRGHERQPSLSPDGNQVAFAWDEGPSSNRDNRLKNYDIYTLALGSEEPVRLTSDSANDTSPSWSPDGQRIALLRSVSEGRASVIVVSSTGGGEQLLARIATYDGVEVRLAWSPDGQWIATSEADPAQSPMRLVLISAKTGEKQRLVYKPAAVGGDVSPSFSPDGRHLAFARHLSPAVADMYVMELPQDGRAIPEAVRVTNWNRWNSTPVWTEDGQELLFVGDEPRAGRRIWRIPAFRRADPRLLNQFGEDSSSIALGPRGRLVYSKETLDTNIWRIDLQSQSDKSTRAVASPLPGIASTRLENNPQYSPDGDYIAYQSERSGEAEIWICKSDGSSARQLTRLHAKVSGYPRWSPDGKHIVFHSRPSGFANIYVIDVETGAYRQLTNGTSNDHAPSWSHDGQWIYFCSGRNDGYRIWRVSPKGGSPTQVTTSEALVAFESPDGKRLFYSKLGQPGLWVVPLAGGAESQILPSLAGFDTFAITREGIFFLRPLERKSVLSFMSFASGLIDDVAHTTAPTDLGLTVSPDGQSILYTQRDQSGSDLVLVDNLK